MVNDDVPGADILKEAGEYQIFTQNGMGVSFRSLFETPLRGHNSHLTRLLVVFIRHFFCGNCQEYIRRIAESLAPSSLPADLSVVIVGCGAPSLISSYTLATNCPYPVYADPDTGLYGLLGTHRTLSLGHHAPEYIQHSLLTGMLKSVEQGVKRIPKGDAFAAGNMSVNGGEFLFVKAQRQGSDTPSPWAVSWCHRMRNSRDHSEIDQLRGIMELGAARSYASALHQDESQRKACVSMIVRPLSLRTGPGSESEHVDTAHDHKDNAPSAGRDGCYGSEMNPTKLRKHLNLLMPLV